MSAPGRVAAGIGARRAAAAALAVGVLAWCAGTQARSLWIDEFHTLYHVRADSFGALLRAVRSDNHPPLSFAAIWGSRALFGESPLALRLPALVCGLVFLGLVARTARRLPDARARSLALATAALSSFAFTIFTEARMYGFLAVALLGLLEATLRALEGRRTGYAALASVLPWIVVGAHSHYYFLPYAFALACAVAWVAWREPASRQGAKQFALAGVLGGLLFTPWAAWGFARQMQHGLPGGANYSDLRGLAESLPHLLFMNASLLASWAPWAIALPGSLAAAWLALLGWRHLRERTTGPLLPLLLTLGLFAPLGCWIVAHWVPRFSYNWRYIAGSCAPVALLVGAGLTDAPSRLRAALASGLVLALVAVLAVNVTTPGQEDFRGSVEHILEHARPGDALLARGVWFRDRVHSPTGWEYYSARSQRAVPDDFLVERQEQYERVLGRQRVWTFVRRRPFPPAMRTLRERYAREERVYLGPVLTVHLFEDPLPRPPRGRERNGGRR